MATYTQDQRRIAVETPLGKDALLLTSFEGQESMSRLFTYKLELLSTKDAISPQEIVGKNVTFWVEYADGSPRYFNGFVSRFAYCGKGDRLNIYRAEVVPWLWFLTRTSDCRIFQHKSVVDIVKQVFSDLGFNDFQTSEIKGSHPTWEYCVQYRETDFAFVSRLLEQQGIFYYFKHEKGKHTLVLADQKGAYKDGVEKEVQFLAPLSAPELTDHISRWEHQYEFRSGKWAQTDYNFETPSTSLMVQTKGIIKLDGASKFEFYDYPGEYVKKPDGDAAVRARMEEEEAPYDTVIGESHVRSFSPGTKFKLVKHHAKAEEGKSYVITSVRHSAAMGGSYVPGADTRGQRYHNHFTCIPDSVTFRPARVTPKPYIHGTQTAVVVGPQGEEIWPDKYGRVLVQFHWDREGKKDEKSSCWIRVAQPWAGKQWGAQHIPRIGQEVVVSFLEGDMDRPLITGMVYNADNMPPYKLPDNKTQTGIKTRSSKDGGADNFNELRFEDKKGSEDIYFHAEKDFHRVVENDDNLEVGNDQNRKIKNNRTVEITMGNDSLNIKQGNQTTRLDLGKSETEALQSIELKVGQSSVKLDQTGVTIKGMMINVEGQIQTQLKGLMTQVTADAILQARGGVTMIG
jgi:type VI secretion system secreted protein VgrG